MSAPDRPTRAQVDADLRRVTEYIPAGEYGLIALRLAAEVRALRAEQEAALVALNADGPLVSAAEFVREAADAFAARTPQPAEFSAIVKLRATIALLGDLADRSLHGELGTEELCREREERIELLHSLGHSLGDDAVALLPAVPDGEDEPDWHNMRERLHTEIGAIVGVTPREERTGDADGDLIEMVRRAVWSTSTREDEHDDDHVPGLKAALAMAQVRQVLAWCDLADERGDGRLHASTVRMVIASATPGAKGPSPDSLSESFGEDVPARLDAAAEAMKKADPGLISSPVELRRVAEVLRRWTSPETRAAVAAALARPTGGQG